MKTEELGSNILQVRSKLLNRRIT